MPGPAQPYVAGHSGGDARQLAYRITFLRAVGLVAPRAVEQLRSKVMPLYEAAWNESQPFVQGHFWPRGWAGLGRIPDEMRGPQVRAFQAALVDWAAAHNLTDPWVLDAVLDHLRIEWKLGEGLPLGSAGGTVAYWQPAQHIRPPEYRPEQRTRAEYQETVRQYMKDVEADYERAGWIRAAAPGEMMKHLLWLARHQVLGDTYEQIQNVVGIENDAPPDLSTVTRGIHRAAEAIGLTLRAAPRR